MLKKFLLALLCGVCAVSVMQAATPEAVARRQKFTAECGENADKAAKYLNDKDPEIRRYALYLYAKANGNNAFAKLQAALNDSNDLVRLTAVSALTELAAKGNKNAEKLLAEVAGKDTYLPIRELAGKASWPFKREIKLLRNDPGWDHEVITVAEGKIEADNWKLLADPAQSGHRRNFYKVKFDDSKWTPAKYGYWEAQNIGMDDYDGIVWYRIRFKAPEKVAHNAFELHFYGVDESAWIWLNGTYLGSHDIGLAGHNKHFAVDATKEVKFGKENLLVVRVKDTGMAGGIWKPIKWEILK